MSFAAGIARRRVGAVLRSSAPLRLLQTDDRLHGLRGLSTHVRRGTDNGTAGSGIGTVSVDLRAASPVSDAQEGKKEKQDGTATVSAKKTTKTAAYLDLAKAKLSALVVATTAAGFVAAGGPLSEQALVAGCCVAGTALCSSSAAAWNQIFEVDRDARMKRTQQRPLVTKKLSVDEATAAATAWGAAGTGLLWFGTDPVTASLGVANIALYSGLYTYMKPRSIYNTWVGAVVGAIPPVMGWTAATGGSLFDVDAVVLGGLLYLWQMPHFFALSYMHRVDYKRGGFAMVPVMESHGERTSNIIMRYTAYLTAVPFATTFAGVTSSMFTLEGIVINSYALYRANKFRQERTNANARKVFLTSLWYLPSWLILFLLHSKVWDEEKDEDVLRDAIVHTVHSVRNLGREACIHEQVVHKQSSPAEAETNCPVTLARKASFRELADATKTTVENMKVNGKTGIKQDV